MRELIQVLELHVELAVRRVLGALFGATVSEETKNETRREVQKGLRAFTQLAKFGPYLAGSEFGMADCVAAVHFPMIRWSAAWRWARTSHQRSADGRLHEADRRASSRAADLGRARRRLPADDGRPRRKVR